MSDPTPNPEASLMNIRAIGDENIVGSSQQPTNSFLPKIFSYIDENVRRFIDTLREAVSIKSVSSWPEARCERFRMVQWTAEKLRRLGCTVDIIKNREQEVPGGKVPMSLIIFASLGNDPAKKTLLIYGHLDVQPALITDGWDSDPFVLTESDGMLHGRGTTDDKGPVLGWVHAIEAYQQCGIEIPVNIKFVLEDQEEVGSLGLEDLLVAQKDKFLSNVDMVCISDNYWIDKDIPCLTYGTRGQLYYTVEVEMGIKDLHSGVFGGSVFEAMTDLIWLLNQLKDDEGNINIPGILDDVTPITDEETEMYKNINFDCKAYEEDAGVRRLSYEDKVQTLMHRWRLPSLSIHSIHGAVNSGTKTVIPHKVSAKFSIRLVPNQMPDKTHKLVEQVLREKWDGRNTPCTMKMELNINAQPWLANPKHPNYQAGINAIKMVYGIKPQMVREGGSIPPALLFDNITKKNVMLLPMGSSNDGAHSQLEKINISNYIQGTKVMAAYFHELGKLKGDI